MALYVGGKKVTRVRSSGGGYRLGVASEGQETVSTKRGSLAAQRVTGTTSTTPDSTEQTFSMTAGGELTETTGGQKTVIRTSKEVERARLVSRREREIAASRQTQRLGFESEVTGTSGEIPVSGGFAALARRRGIEAAEQARILQPTRERGQLIRGTVKTGGRTTPFEGIQLLGERMTREPPKAPVRDRMTPAAEPSRARQLIGRSLMVTGEDIQRTGVGESVKRGAVIGATTFVVGGAFGGATSALRAASPTAGRALSVASGIGFGGLAATQIAAAERSGGGINLLDTATGVAGFGAGYGRGRLAFKALESGRVTSQMRADLARPVGTITYGRQMIRSRSVTLNKPFASEAVPIPKQYQSELMGSFPVMDYSLRSKPRLYTQKTFGFAGGQNVVLRGSRRAAVKKTMPVTGYEALGLPSGATRQFIITPTRRARRMRQSVNFPLVTQEAAFNILSSRRYSPLVRTGKGEFMFSSRSIRPSSIKDVPKGFTMSEAAGYAPRKIRYGSPRVGSAILDPSRLLPAPRRIPSRPLFSDPTGGILTSVTAIQRGVTRIPKIPKIRQPPRIRGRDRITARPRVGVRGVVRGRGLVFASGGILDSFGGLGALEGTRIRPDTRTGIDTGTRPRSSVRRKQDQRTRTGLIFSSSLTSIGIGGGLPPPPPSTVTPRPPPTEPPIEPTGGGLPPAFIIPSFGIGKGTKSRGGRKRTYGYAPSLTAAFLPATKSTGKRPRTITGFEVRRKIRL